MMVTIALVSAGGFFGAIARFAMSRWFKNHYATTFPIATLIVNLVGAFLLGVIIGKDLSQQWQLLLGTGFMGAFTTFSTFKLENIQFHSNKKWHILVVYLGITYTFGILLAFLGMKLGGM